MPEEVETVLSHLVSRLCNHAKLERDAALRQLSDQLPRFSPSDLTHLQQLLLSELKRDSSEWESRQGCLLACKTLLDASKTDPQLQSDLTPLCMTFLTDDEARVRLAAGQVLGSLCFQSGAVVYEQCSSRILDLISTNMNRTEPGQQAEEVVQKLVGSQGPEGTVEAEQVFHDTAGWHNLETSIKCLQEMVEGCGVSFAPYFDRALLDLLEAAFTHTNRFVRETGYYLLGALVAVGSEHLELAELAQWLAKGLGDNWSQVRLAASVAARRFVTRFSDKPSRDIVLPLLVPAMCLNRYYLAEGVRLYSQETWRLVSGGQGIALVSTYLEQVVKYYVTQTAADNHAVREAACHAITELAVKIDVAVLQPQLQILLDALIECFQDESWPVRDAACLACGRFLALFPSHGEPLLEKLLPLFWSQLEDCIPSVRQGAAESLARVTSAYGAVVLDWLLPRVTEGLKRIQQQEGESKSGMEPGLTQFGVAKRIHDNDPQLHTGQQMFSCGSLAPKMGRAGCGDHTFRRPANPWETTDGCVQLVAELSADAKLAPKLVDLLPKIIESCRSRHFVHHVQFLETVCRRLPQMARNFGKRFFKPHLQDFLEPLMYSLSCDTELTRVAAECCVQDWAQFFGPSILRGRIEMMDNMDFLDLYDKTVPR